MGVKKVEDFLYEVTGPYIEVLATDREGNLLLEKEGNVVGIPGMQQEGDFSIFHMVYEVMYKKLGYYPLKILGYCVDEGKITFRCEESVKIDNDYVGLKEVKKIEYNKLF